MKNSPVRVMLIGAAGRMGTTVLDLARSDREIEIAAQCDLGDAIEPAMKNCDVAIDFSQADSVDEVCRAASQHGKSLVIGTTGHSQQQRKTIEETAQSVPIVLASNFSVGVNVLFWLDPKAADSLARISIRRLSKRITNEKRCAERDSQNVGRHLESGAKT